MSAAIQVVLIDDHAPVRAGMRMILESAGVCVIGEAAEGERGVSMVRSLRPDVVLMDVRMPGVDGVEATRRIVAESLAPVLILTTFDLDEYLFATLRAGAAGFVLKSADAADLVRAVRDVAAGRGAVDPEMTRRLIAEFASVSPPRVEPELNYDGDANLIASLTSRERAVLRALGEGLSNRLISRQLGIAETTVKTHVSNVLTKLGLQSRVQAAIFYAEHDV
ncbi:response regulator [Haematomicrobium sanguinis]|uniref:response regulator n=1 Tax=Haematomicrobium sanguinis TaxID=479106 RepID=UPI0004799E16|nr:response regulator transcription factor [Haematomicrobium sanguinis]